MRPSSCKIVGRWDFANSTNSGKYTKVWDTTTSTFLNQGFQAYRLTRRYLPTGAGDTFDYGQNVISTKNKIRGSGKSLTLYFASESGYDMNILGWNIVFTGGTRV